MWRKTAEDARAPTIKAVVARVRVPQGMIKALVMVPREWLEATINMRVIVTIKKSIMVQTSVPLREMQATSPRNAHRNYLRWPSRAHKQQSGKYAYM
jgi:hypothetical protein